MTTWTLEQVAQARGLRAKVALDDELVYRSGDRMFEHAEELLAYAAGEMAKQLIEMAHPFAIELHHDDFEVQWTRNPKTPWQLTGETRWRPSTREVELVGGHLDGQRYTVQRVGDPIRVLRPAEPLWKIVADIEASSVITEIADTYHLAGWREAERVWAYAPA